MKHINDLNQALSEFSMSNFYSVTIQQQKGSNIVAIAIFREFPIVNAALVIGDALHNLRSALDLLYYRIFNEVTGKSDKFTRFPVRDTRQELIAAINGGLKEKKLTDHRGAVSLRDFIVDDVKPYETGNRSLWTLHEMNITDKHQLLIPVFKIMRFTDISLEDADGNIFLADGQPYFTDGSYWFRVRDGELKVDDKGHAATTIVFGVGVPSQNQPVIPSLTKLAEDVTRTIEAFEGLQISAVFLD